MRHVLLMLLGLLALAVVMRLAVAQFPGPIASHMSVPSNPALPPQTISSITPSSCTFTNGTSSNCAISVTMRPSTPIFSGTLSLVSSGGTCSGTGDTTHFGTSNSPYAITYNGTAAAGSYSTCLRASASGIPSAYQQVSITINSAGTGIACNFGPSYTGTIPAPAQAAGFTTCAYNLDFTQSSMSNINTWFNCPDNATGTANDGTHPALGYAGGGAAAFAPCSDYAIASDTELGVSQVLEVTFTQSDYSNDVGWTVLRGDSAYNQPSPPGILFPNGNYVEITYRDPQGDLNNLQNTLNQSGGNVLHSAPFYWSKPGSTNGTAFMEWDPCEVFAANTTTCSMNAGGWDGEACCQLNTQTIPSGGNITQYHTYANLITQDTSGNWGQCGYIDGQSTGTCNAGTFNGGSSSASITQENELAGVWFGGLRPASTGATCGGSNTCLSPTGTLYQFVKRITVWSCSAWRNIASSHGCANVAIQTPP